MAENESNGQQAPIDTLWTSADALLRAAFHPDNYVEHPGTRSHQEHLGGGYDFRILVERSPHGGRRVVIADDRWLRQHGGYFPEAR